MAWYICMIALLLLLVGFVKWCFLSHTYCHLEQSLKGKHIVVTGCNQGIGYETVAELAKRGARVVMACRNMVRCKRAREQLLKRLDGDMDEETESKLVCEELDLESTDSIRAFATRMIRCGQPIDILINNAGASFAAPKFGSDGIEAHLRVNHLGHFFLVQLLLPLLEASKSSARVIILSSLMHRLCSMNLRDICHPHFGTPYSNSKLANVMHAIELSERYGPQITAVSVHPGLVKTEIFQYSTAVHWLLHKPFNWLCKTPLQGAQTTIHCCLAKDLVPGGYYSECCPAQVHQMALDPMAREKVWTASEQLVERWLDSNSRL